MTLRTPRLLARYRLCFVLPATAFAYLATAPHPGPRAYLWLLVIAGSILADVRSRAERGDPPAARPGWPFDAVLYVLAGLQFVNLALLVRLVARGGSRRGGSATSTCGRGIAGCCTAAWCTDWRSNGGWRSRSSAPSDAARSPSSSSRR